LCGWQAEREGGFFGSELCRDEEKNQKLKDNVDKRCKSDTEVCKGLFIVYDVIENQLFDFA